MELESRFLLSAKLPESSSFLPVESSTLQAISGSGFFSLARILTRRMSLVKSEALPTMASAEKTREMKPDLC